MEQHSEVNTICETLRQIYLYTNDSFIRLKCREATAQAKAMSRRLRRYKDSASYTNRGFW